MSIRYRAADGTETIVSGLTPGGDIEAGTVMTRTGQVSVTGPSSFNSTLDTTITFSEPLPDADYIVDISSSGADLSFTVLLKTASGFRLRTGLSSNDGVGKTTTVTYTATKTYTVQHAAQNAADIADIKAMIPSSASSTNKFSTADDLRTETRALDRRLDDVEDAIPATASITNQLATQNDLSNIEIDELGEINDVDLTNLADGQTLVWDDANSKWVNGQGGKMYTAGDGIDISSTDEISAKINPAQFDFDADGKMSLNSEYKKTFIGTKAEWDALSASKKKEYTIANITDDVIGGEVADVVQDGLMSPVTSNAVYDFPIDNLINGEHRPPTANTVLAHIQPLLTGNYGGTVPITPNLVADLETGFQNAGEYSLFYVSSQASEEGGFIGFRHNANKNCYVIGISSAWGVCIGLRNHTSGTWTFKRIEAI